MNRNGYINEQQMLLFLSELMTSYHHVIIINTSFYIQFDIFAGTDKALGRLNLKQQNILH